MPTSASPPRPIGPATHRAVLDWYGEHGRSLAFRGTTDPWAILVSEVMAQQTQVARAAAAWPGFMRAFPAPADLAGAPPAAVIRAWRGLGYNRRALALRDAAILITREHDGAVPGDVDALRRLPGVGPYTARAVAALAFGAAVGPVDVNVRRVLARAFFDAPPSARRLQAFADAAVPPGAAGEWTHALMDLGARLCRPRGPRCEDCPLRRSCRFVARGRMADPPVPVRRATSGSFTATPRWLRGRILDRLRDAGGGDWVTFDDPIGPHGLDAVARELGRLAAEGLLEQRPDRHRAARLPG